MVCTGNICRSTMAEVVFAHHCQQAGLDVHVDSAGISNEEAGNPIDYRAATVLQAAGYPASDHRARQVKATELAGFDLILAMTNQHYTALEHLAKRAGLELNTPGNPSLKMFKSFTPEFANLAPSPGYAWDLDVADPWYGNRQDFEDTLATVEAALPALLAYVRHLA